MTSQLTQIALKLVKKYNELINYSEKKAEEIKKQIEELRKRIKEFEPKYIPKPDGEYECPFYELIDFEEPYCHRCDMYYSDDPELFRKCKGKVVIKDGKMFCPVFGCLGEAKMKNPEFKKMQKELEELESEYKYYYYYDYVHKQLEKDVNKFLGLIQKEFKEDKKRNASMVFNDEFSNIFGIEIKKIKTEIRGTKYEIEMAFYKNELIAVLVSYHYIDYWGADTYYNPNCNLFNNNMELLRKFEEWHFVQRELEELCRYLFDDKVLFSVDVDALSLVSRSKEAIEKLLEQHEQLFRLRELEPIIKLFNKLSWCDAIVVIDGENAYPVKKSKYNDNEYYYKKTWKLYKLSDYVLSGIYFRNLERKDYEITRNNHKYIVFKVK